MPPVYRFPKRREDSTIPVYFRIIVIGPRRALFWSIGELATPVRDTANVFNDNDLKATATEQGPSSVSPLLMRPRAVGKDLE